MSSKPTFNLVSVNNTQSNMRGGYSYGANYTSAMPAGTSREDDATRGDNEELYKHKAKKYHYKCQAKLTEMRREAERKNPGQSWVCPAGFEKYLKPFQA